MLDPRVYTTLTAQCFSPKGNHLAVGQSDPNSRSPLVAIFDVLKILDKDEQEGSSTRSKRSSQACISKFSLPNNKPIMSLTSTSTELIVGASGEISAYPWKDLLKNSPRRSWHINVAPQPGAPIPTEINWMEADESVLTAGRLFAAGGDNIVHIYDLETRQEVQALRGHEGYLHGLSHCPGTNLVSSCCEDGAVRLWDTENPSPCIHILQPHTRPELARPRFGNWIGAVSLTQEWVGCGGGPSAALWHLRTLSPQEPLPPFDAPVHVMKIHNQGDRIIIGGEGSILYQTNLNGQVLAEVKVSSNCLYSVVCQENPVKILSAVGSSSDIDICAPNFNYLDQTIDFPVPPMSEDDGIKLSPSVLRTMGIDI